MGWPFWARRRFAGRKLVADDSGWAGGAGPEIHGSTLDLLLLLTGRQVTLTGPRSRPDPLMTHPSSDRVRPCAG
ncbi:hypothetical protein [Nocardia rhizosphaerae]|uniref:Uncharacterized protein n=1 Tax=Nocardia rhizosphaerae TaxID=1691571 RepID=A0ABV8KYN8_9NOCA